MIFISFSVFRKIFYVIIIIYTLGAYDYYKGGVHIFKVLKIDLAEFFVIYQFFYSWIITTHWA